MPALRTRVEARVRADTLSSHKLHKSPTSISRQSSYWSPLPHLSSKAGGGTRMSLEPPAGRAPAVPAAVPSAWPRSPSSPSAASTRSHGNAPSRRPATARATSNDDSCACTRARRRIRELDVAAGPRPAARAPAARLRRHRCSLAFARSVPYPRCVAGAQRFLHACERAT